MTTPQPPQGGNSYGQQPLPQAGNPYAQAPQGGNPYAQQPGVPGQPPQPSPYLNQGGGFPSPGPQPSGGRSKAKLIKNVVVAVFVVVVAIVGFIASQNDADHAEAGDCMHKVGGTELSPDLEVIDCGDSKAQYEVLKKIQDGSQSDCDSVAGYQYAYTETRGDDSFVLCLKDK